MRYYQLLKEEKSIDDIVKILKNERPVAYEAMLDRRTIWRGMRDVFTFQELKPRKRKSANTSNHYTLLIDNMPSWSQYPKRSESFICTTDNNRAALYGYGNFYVMLPEDDANIGICPRGDIWTSFPILNDYLDIRSLHMFNNYLKKHLSVDDTDIETITRQLKNIDQNREDYPHVDKLLVDENKSLLENLQYLLDPNRNGFELKNLRDFYSSYGMYQDKEIWTDSSCYILNKQTFNEIMNKNKRQ